MVLMKNGVVLINGSSTHLLARKRNEEFASIFVLIKKIGTSTRQVNALSYSHRPAASGSQPG